MTVSVIIPYYNKKEFIFATLDSLNNQVYKDFEVIIVDDGSDEKLEDFLNFNNYFFPLKLIRQINKGLSAARNTGLLNCNGTLISFLDADDVWSPNKLEIQVQFMDKYDFVYCNYKIFANEIYSAQTVFNKYESSNLKIDLLKGNCISGSASSVMISKNLYDKVGLFNVSLIYAEDWDYWLRCFQVSSRFKFIDEPLVFIRSNFLNGTFLNNHEFKFSILQKMNSVSLIFDNLISSNLFFSSFDSSNLYLYKAYHTCSFGFSKFIVFRNYIVFNYEFLKSFKFSLIFRFNILIINLLFSRITVRNH